MNHYVQVEIEVFSGSVGVAIDKHQSFLCVFVKTIGWGIFRHSHIKK